MRRLIHPSAHVGPMQLIAVSHGAPIAATCLLSPVFFGDSSLIHLF
jgi:hypothetical protein